MKIINHLILKHYLSHKLSKFTDKSINQIEEILTEKRLNPLKRNIYKLIDLYIKELIDSKEFLTTLKDAKC